MARQGWGRHTVVATGSNDATKQVSVNAWNNDLDNDGVLGFTPETIASASTVTPTNSLVKLSGSTSIDTIAIANSSEGDLLWVYTSGSVTLNNTSSPSSDGDIRLLANANKDLSTTTPTVLIRISTYWYEYLTGEQNAVTASSTTTFTNKTIDADGTGNSITNIENANIKASAGIDASKIADASVSDAEFQRLDGVSSDIQGQIDGKQASLTFGIADTNAVKIDGSGTATGEYAKFTTTGIIGEEVADVKTDLSLNNVENTALSTWAGTTNVTTLGTITTGTWTGTAIADDNGGTGQTTYSTGDILYASGSNTLAKLAVGSNTNVLTLAGGVPTWAASGGGFGAQQFWCDGGAFIPTPSSTAGTATSYGQTRVLSNGVSVSSVVLPEHATIDSRCTFTWTPPENWNAGTILAKIYWTMEDTTTTSVGDTGAFEVSAVAISNDDTLNASFGTAVAVTDVFLATNDLHVAAISGAITVGGSPANADLVQIQINRNAGSDTLEAGSNVELLGIILEYTQDASTSSG